MPPCVLQQGSHYQIQGQTNFQPFNLENRNNNFLFLVDSLAVLRISRHKFEPVWAEIAENYPSRKLELLSPQNSSVQSHSLQFGSVQFSSVQFCLCLQAAIVPPLAGHPGYLVAAWHQTWHFHLPPFWNPANLPSLTKLASSGSYECNTI